MKNLIIFTFVLVLFINPKSIFSQEEEKSFGIKFTGFIKNDAFFDSRQNVVLREGHFLMFPKDIELDANGNDINDGLNFNMLSIQSRLTGSITGPDAFGAKTSGVLEGEFFGHSDADINGFRLRHAFAKLNWTNTELLAGQTWHPLFATACFPDVISFNTGVPFIPFSRNPQLRISQKVDNVKLFASINSQRDITSAGGSTSLRNSGIPEVHGQIQFHKKNEESGCQLYAGLGGGYKFLKPALFTIGDNNKKYKSDELVGGFNSMAYIKYVHSKVTAKVQATYGENLTDLLMLGGYAVADVIIDSTGHVSYLPTKTFSVWSDIHSNGKRFQVGLFSGFTQNQGAKNDIKLASFAGRFLDINYVYRFSPRFVFIHEKVKFAIEFEHTVAAYARALSDGTNGINPNGMVSNYEEVANNRFLFSVIYSF